MSKKYISLIIPVPQMESIIQDYRFKYDFFAKKGIPSHITLIYKMDLKMFNKHKNEILCLLRAAVNNLSKKKITATKIKRNDKLLFIQLNNNNVDFLKALQTLLFEYLDQKSIPLYDNHYDEHNITILTGKNNPGWEKANMITKNINSKLPKHFNINKIWILEIDKKKNKADILYSISK